VQCIKITEGGGGTEIRYIVFYLINILLIKSLNKLCLTIFSFCILWFYTTQHGCVTWTWEVFLWILHTNIGMLCPLFPPFAHPNKRNGAVLKQ